MSDLRKSLKNEFQNEDYRYAYAESFLNTKLAAQIKVLREARGKTQAEIGCLVGTSQSGFSRFEDVNHRVWKTDTLWKIARALGVRLDISFETFGSLIKEKEQFGREFLHRPDFGNDPVFLEDEFVGSAQSQVRIKPVPNVTEPPSLPVVRWHENTNPYLNMGFPQGPVRLVPIYERGRIQEQTGVEGSRNLGSILGAPLEQTLTTE